MNYLKQRMYKDFDVIKAKTDINMVVQKDCIGVILAIYGEPAKNFLIEFVDKNNNKLDLITVEAEQIELKD